MAKTYVGIDVSYKEFWVAFCPDDKKTSLVKSFENNSTGFEALLLWLQTYPNHSFHFVIEATGAYHSRLAVHLWQADQVVSVVNPLTMKRYAQMCLWRSKTDSQDAQLICQYGELHQPPAWQPPSEDSVKIKQVYTLYELLIKQKNQLTNHQHAQSQRAHIDEQVQTVVQQEIEHLEDRIKEMAAYLDQLAQQQAPELYKNLLTIAGIGPKTACLLIAVTAKFENFEQAKALIAYAGLAPRQYQSGTSVKGKAHICKMGMGQLRKLLYMCALTAIKSNKACQQLYQRLRQRGKLHRVALIAVAAKLLRQAFGVAKSGQAYEENLAMGK
ncbi:MAG: IS110 family transposase [Bacteroidia bacterium]|nr:IS110 family transposase [Bacteroidia bacterium]